MVVAQADILAADGKIQEARSAYQQAVDELETKQELYRRNPGIVACRDIEKLAGRRGGTPGRGRCRHRRESRPPRRAALDAAPGREGKRRSGSGPGRGRIWRRPSSAPV